MTDDSHEPPNSDVPQVLPAQPGVARPQTIIQAIALLWISAGLGFAGSYSEVAKSQTTLIVSSLMMLAVAGALTAGIWRGRHWARILYLVLVVMSLAAMVSAWGTVERPRFEVALEAVSFVADAGSFFLLFTSPGSSWFRPATEP